MRRSWTSRRSERRDGLGRGVDHMSSRYQPRSAPTDWTPVVVLVCSLSLALAALAWILPRWLPGPEAAEPGIGVAEHGAP